jgi:hypothetical protein
VRSIFDPASVAMPATSNRFFTAKGTPASGMRLRRGLASTSAARLSGAFFQHGGEGVDPAVGGGDARQAGLAPRRGRSPRAGAHRVGSGGGGLCHGACGLAQVGADRLEHAAGFVGGCQRQAVHQRRHVGRQPKKRSTPSRCSVVIGRPSVAAAASM